MPGENQGSERRRSGVYGCGILQLPGILSIVLLDALDRAA